MSTSKNFFLFIRGLGGFKIGKKGDLFYIFLSTEMYLKLYCSEYDGENQEVKNVMYLTFLGWKIN